MYKPVITLAMAALFSLSAKSQQDTVRYELVKDMPLFYQQMKGLLHYPMAWENAGIKRFGKWRKAARKTLLSSMASVPPRTVFETTTTAVEKRDGYEARKVEFNISAWSRIPAYLLVPEGEGPFAAIVLLHDHGAHFSIGKEKMVRPFDAGQAIMDDAEEWTRKCYDGMFVGDELAKRGYVVLAIDALFWGERGRKEGIRYDSQQALASNLMQMGMSWSAMITSDDMACADFLASLPEVDADRIGCFGFSMGAYRSWMLAAATDRIQAAASVCWMSTTDALMTLDNNQNKGGSAYAMLIPGLRNYLDYPHVASIACPKPMLFFNGTRDKLFPTQGVEDAYRAMQQTWESQKAGDKLITRLWDEKHFFNRAMMEEVLTFFDRYLKQR